MFPKELIDEEIVNIVVNPQPTQNLEEKISCPEAAESPNKFISFAEFSTSGGVSEIIDFLRNKK